MGFIAPIQSTVQNIQSPTSLAGMYTQYGVNPNGSKRAQELSAAITRQQFDDYKTRFMPYLAKLNGMVTDESVAQQQQDWRNQLMTQYQAQPAQGYGMTQRNLSRYGGAVDERAQGFGLRQAQLDSAANTVAQINSGNQQIKDRAMVLMSGQKLTPG